MRFVLILLSLVVATLLHATPVLPPGYHLVFDQSFNDPAATLSIPPGTGWDPGGTYVWHCHTPYSGDFGLAYFSGPQDASDKLSPFVIDPNTGQLIIRAWFDSTKQHWRSGLLCTMGYNGLAVPGGLVANGYFECSMQPYPAPGGVWPAFWLTTGNNIKGRTTNAAEVDVAEIYGVDMHKVHQLLHIWSPTGAGLPGGASNTVTTFNPVSNAHHRYGVLMGSTTITWYIDDRPVFSCPATPETQLPCCAIVNLGMGGGWPIDDAAISTIGHPAYPPRLYIDYVKIWSP